MTRTLFILPSAIGDVIAGRGVADRLALDGPVTWVVNELAAPVLADAGFKLIHPPSPLIRQMTTFGAPTESIREITKQFLDRLMNSGPYERVVQVHLSRAAALMAGVISLEGPEANRCGPAIGATSSLAGGIVSDPWSDFFLGSIHSGFSPEIPAPVRFSLIAGLAEPALPEDAAFSTASGAATSPLETDRSLERASDGPLLLCPVAGWPSKTLGCDQAAAIADVLSELGDVELLGAPADRDFLSAIVARQKSGSAVLRTGSLSDALSAIRRAPLVVTADSWPLHAATVARRPVLALLGSTRVFPRGPSAMALAPATAATWMSDGDRTIDLIDTSTIQIVAAALRNGASPDERSIPNTLRLWKGPGIHPFPNKPLPSGGIADTRILLSWARARGFEAVLKSDRPDLPRIPLRSASDFVRLHADQSGALARARKAFSSGGPGSFLDSFMLFPTTFPDRDANRLISRWIDAARIELDRLEC